MFNRSRPFSTHNPFLSFKLISLIGIFIWLTSIVGAQNYTFNGTLTVANGRVPHVFTVTGGDYNMEITTATFDTVMWLYNNATNAQLAYNDDGGVGLYSRIQSNLPAGTYRLEVGSYAGFYTGSYTLQVFDLDGDGDGIPDASDNCPNDSNADQADFDGDGVGDVCDTDDDGDGVNDGIDNCLNLFNPTQTDTDGDGIGDLCDGTASGDTDEDGIENVLDNCPTVPNVDQADSDGDGNGDACDAIDNLDNDADGIENFSDNCVTVPNVDQADLDNDGVGDACDRINNDDIDNDGVSNTRDECDDLGDMGYGVADNGCPPHIVEPPDDRINWQFGDLYTVIYEHDLGTAVYCYNQNTWLAMHITQQVVDVADPEQPQDVPVLEYTQNGCSTAFYILDSGEYQINIWSFEGKLYEVIADNIFFQDATMRYFDPLE